MIFHHLEESKLHIYIFVTLITQTDNSITPVVAFEIRNMVGFIHSVLLFSFSH